MADTKLSGLTALAAGPAATDEFYIRDVSEAAADESKRIVATEMLNPENFTELAATPATTDEFFINDGGTGKKITFAHLSATKCWGYLEIGGTLQSPDYNVSSRTDTGTGDQTINFTTSMSGAIYSATCNAGGAEFVRALSHGTASVRFISYNDAGTATDASKGFSVHGDY
jgi:hypothetical protein